ncbi:MAG: hypothetical protein DVB25_04705 [Verrucomicrobia bacterium]|nr:MAG: hypothetical protein DVB25_04705 [Verrucomicrobiota bacterium]
MPRSDQRNEEIERHVRRLVGLVTLRRLSKMADAEIAAESRNEMRAKRIIIALIVLAALLVGGLWLRQII